MRLAFAKMHGAGNDFLLVLADRTSGALPFDPNDEALVARVCDRHFGVGADGLIALRLAPAGIPVFEVRPGIIATDMTAAVREMYDARIADGLVPERRWGQPEDVGRAVAALVRGDVPYATGTVVHVDGGLALPRL